MLQTFATDGLSEEAAIAVVSGSKHEDMLHIPAAGGFKSSSILFSFEINGCAPSLVGVVTKGLRQNSKKVYFAPM